MARNKILTELAVAGAMLLVGWVAMYAAFGTPYPFYVVASGSMVPALEVNDILLVQGHDPIEAVEIGDIIVFDRPDGAEKVIVHRVVEVISDDPRTLRTRGDANQISIPGTDFPITEETYIGKVMYTVPKVGYVTKALAPPVNYILIAIIIGFMVFKHVRASRAAPVPAPAGPRAPGPDRDVGDLDAVPRDGEYSEIGGAAGEPTARVAGTGPGRPPQVEPFPPPRDSAEPQNHYAVLGLDRTASAAEVRESYSRLTAVHAGDDEAIGRITRAYDVLSDPERRGRHDGDLDFFAPRPARDVGDPGASAQPRRMGGDPPAAPPQAPEPPDHYAVLGLDRAASTPEIRERHSRLIAEHAGDEAMIERITRAYGVLSDPGRRRDYDREHGSA